ncbi:MAG TPA: peptidase S9, partial [Bacteroidales bacterium]|nr:peptidase S9 [Bacteroidales bacterium]
MMKKLSIITLLLVIALMGGCKTEKREKAVTPVIDVSLTDAEKSGGVLTPEIMWKYGRVGGIALSPDGSTVLFQVTNYDLLTEARATNIWSVPA